MQNHNFFKIETGVKINQIYYEEKILEKSVKTQSDLWYGGTGVCTLGISLNKNK